LSYRDKTDYAREREMDGVDKIRNKYKCVFGKFKGKGIIGD
jgi:hypothetical protein